MNIRACTTQFGSMLLVVGLAVGCAQQTTTTEAPPEEPCEASAAALNAIDAAKAAQAEVAAVSSSWRDTDDLIKQAIAAADECDNDKAIKMANQAKRQAENALRQYQAENAKFEPATEVAPVVATSTAVGRYEVESGDSLWAISGQDFVYGDPYQWPLIYRSNTSIIEDADLIYPGQWLEFDPNPGSADIERAVNHAKTRGAWALGAVEASDIDYIDNN